VKTDSIFYRLFKEFPGIFFELIGDASTTASAYNFKSIEVKQTAFRIDGVFIPKRGKDKPTYFIEVQFQQDQEIYSRLISEVSLYLRQNTIKNDWYGVVIYPRKSLDVADTKHFREFFDSGRVTRIYLEDLGDDASLPIGIATIKLIVENKRKAKAKAKELVARTKQQGLTQPQQLQLLDLIGTILLYKLPKINRKELRAMFGISDLKKTTFYQEVKEEIQEELEQQIERKIEKRIKQKVKQEVKEEVKQETKLESVPGLIAMGLTPEQIAQALDINVELVRQVVQNNDSGS
jgi:predicted transposase/invertase (TIGR01784 family)